MSRKSNSKKSKIGRAKAANSTPVNVNDKIADTQKHAYLRVAEAIKLQILNGQLKPGDRLPSENELARKHGVGRTTARESLRLLASARLIKTKRGVQGGAFVTHPTSDDLDDLMMTALSLMTMNGELDERELAEATQYTMPTVARIGTLRGTDQELSKLVNLAALLAEAKDDEEWVEVGMQFNRLVIEMTRNRVLAMFLKPLAWIAPSRHKDLRQEPGWYEETAAHYKKLADAMRQREPAEAYQAMLGLQQCYGPFWNEPAIDQPVLFEHSIASN